MSFIYRDLLGPSLATFAAYSRLYKTFDSVWPKIGSVYADKLIFYNGGYLRKDIKMKKFVTSLGMKWEDYINIDKDLNKDVEYLFFRLGGGFIWDGSIRPSGIANSTAYASTSGLIAPSVTDVINRMNNYFIVGEEYDVTVTYGGASRRYISDHELGWIATGSGITIGGLNIETIRNTLESNPWYYMGNSRHVPYTNDTQNYFSYDGSNSGFTPQGYSGTPSSAPTCSVTVTKRGSEEYEQRPNDIDLAVFALWDTSKSVWDPVLNSECEKRRQKEIKEVLEQAAISGIYDYTILMEKLNAIEECAPLLNEDYLDTNIVKETVSTKSVSGGEAIEYSYTRRFRYKGVGSDLVLLNNMMSWYSHYDQSINSNTDIDSFITSTVDTTPKKALRRLMTGSATNSLYTGGYLNVTQASEMKRKDFAKMIGLTIDIDYGLYPKGIASTIISIVIIVIIVVVAFLTQQWYLLSGPGAGATAGVGANLALAGSIAAGAMAGVLVGSALTVMTQSQLSSSHAKRIGAFIQIVGIIGTIAGIINIIGQWYTKLAQEAAKQAVAEGGKEAVKQTVLEQAMSMVDIVIDMALEKAKEAVKLTAANVMSAVDWGLKAYKYFELEPQAKENEVKMAQLKVEQDEFDEAELERRMDVNALYIADQTSLHNDVELDVQTSVVNKIQFYHSPSYHLGEFA